MEMIVALDERGGIAKDGQIPWLGQFPEDMKFFKETTMGHAVFMGRTTFFSLPPRFRPLPYRTNIVYTRTPEKYDNSSDPYFSLVFSDEGPDKQQIKNQTIFIIGGSQIYNQFYNQCDVIWVTRIQDDYQCDTFLDINKLIENYWLAEIVLQGEGFVIEKYRRCGVKRAEPCNGAKRFYDSFPRISTRVETPNGALSARVETPNGALSTRVETPNGALSTRVETPNGALSEANSEKNKKRRFSDQTLPGALRPSELVVGLQRSPEQSGVKCDLNNSKIGKHKLLQSFRLLTDIFTRTTKRVHHKNNENT